MWRGKQPPCSNYSLVALVVWGLAGNHTPLPIEASGARGVPPEDMPQAKYTASSRRANWSGCQSHRWGRGKGWSCGVASLPDESVKDGRVVRRYVDHGDGWLCRTRSLALVPFKGRTAMRQIYRLGDVGRESLEDAGQEWRGMLLSVGLESRSVCGAEPRPGVNARPQRSCHSRPVHRE